MPILTKTQLAAVRQSALALLQELVNAPERQDLLKPIELTPSRIKSERHAKGEMGSTLWLAADGLMHSEMMNRAGPTSGVYFDWHLEKPSLELVTGFNLDPEELRQVLVDLTKRSPDPLPLFESDAFTVRCGRTTHDILIHSKHGPKTSLSIAVDTDGRFHLYWGDKGATIDEVGAISMLVEM